VKERSEAELTAKQVGGFGQNRGISIIVAIPDIDLFGRQWQDGFDVSASLLPGERQRSAAHAARRDRDQI
jgi:hypothetical protein